MNHTKRHALSTRSRADFSSQISGTAAEKLSSESLIEAWFSEVSPYGTLTVQNFPFKVHIHPLNLTDYPDMNKSIVKMYYDSECDSGNRENISGRKLSEIGKVYEMNVSVSEDGEKMHITCKQPPGVTLPVVCEMFLPMRFGITMVSDHDISISDMESDNITIHLLNGDCHLKHIKSGAVSVSCDKGNITTEGHLLGNIWLHCGRQGKIVGERFQGTTVLCKTEDGDVNIKMLYTEKSDFSSGSGDIILGGSHGNISAESKRGNLTVGSLDGSLHVNLENGSADVFVAKSENVFIDTKQGDVTLRLPERASYSLDLNALQVEKDDIFSRDTDQQGNGKTTTKQQSSYGN
ncbi:hypothetical protein C0Q70_15693 [Pomacea canaliculata]|uniref:DUF4097 domain-containing protein n=1 Tax=Pomacea canaliculata TaxID=400727 RepID=A0A2T7NVK7_POMCA|nr:hypothetical protein C0Q70_15693 [Pomacea canaliculata]